MSRTHKIAWAAGFYEGDGNVINTQHNKSNGWVGIRLSVGQKDKYPLLLLQECWGGSLIHRTPKKGTQMWIWSVCGARALIFIEDVMIWLSPRRIKQINKAKGIIND